MCRPLVNQCRMTAVCYYLGPRVEVVRVRVRVKITLWFRVRVRV